MGMYQLTNVPPSKSSLEIKSHVEGENIYVISAEKNSQWRDGKSVLMTSIIVGDHMLAQPEALRRMYADDIATAIRMGRDAGYAQAKAELRDWLGIQRR